LIHEPEAGSPFGPRTSSLHSNWKLPNGTLINRKLEVPAEASSSSGAGTSSLRSNWKLPVRN